MTSYYETTSKSCYIMLYHHHLIEGSLEVKLPTIWTDEKQSRAEAQVGTAGPQHWPQPRAPDLSGHCRTSTANPKSQARQCPCQRECQKRCQIECQNRIPDRCQNEWLKRCKIECQNKGQIKCQNRCQIECQNECQIECHMECQKKNDRKPERMSDRMSEYIMPEYSIYIYTKYTSRRYVRNHVKNVKTFVRVRITQRKYFCYSSSLAVSWIEKAECEWKPTTLQGSSAKTRRCVCVCVYYETYILYIYILYL